MRGLRLPAASFKAWLFARDLRRLNEALADTDLSGRYLVSGGLLLGWAREGRVLRHDSRDADFGVRTEDLSLLEAVVPALRRAGFDPFERHVANDGHVTALCFRRRRRWHPTRFDFALVDRIAGNQLRYVAHGWYGDRPVEIECRGPEQPVVPFEFLGRTWFRHADFDLELTTLYGDWRTPLKHWELSALGTAFCCRAWTHPDTSWPG